MARWIAIFYKGWLLVLQKDHIKKLREGVGPIQSVTGYLGMSLVCAWGGALRERYNCYFWSFFGSIGGFLFAGGG